MRPVRTAWTPEFPNVRLLAAELQVKRHSAYAEAKTGNPVAAAKLVSELVPEAAVDAIGSWLAPAAPLVASVHAQEAQGINAIPEALADRIAQRLGWDTDEALVQANVVNHTGADGFTRLARQALFEGRVRQGVSYLICDDFVGQGGTMANFRGHIEWQGGRVIAAVALTGKPYSAKLALSDEQLVELRARYGQLEPWWHERFGFGFDALTQSEARYLARTADADTIRNRLVAAEQTRNGGGGEGDVGGP